MISYVYYKSEERWGSFWNQYGPLILVSLSLPFLMADPIRHVLKDKEIWTNPWSNMYVCESESMRCLSVCGWLFSVVFTYVGFILLMWGISWNANIMGILEDIGEKWTEIRTGRKARDSATEV